MVIRKGQIHLMTDGYHIPFWGLYYSRLLLDVSYSQDSYLRLIDDRCTEQRLECTEVRNRKSATGNIIGHQLIITSLECQ